MDLGLRDRILYGAAFNFKKVATLHGCVHAVKSDVVGDGMRTIYCRGPCPGQDSPRAADLSLDQRFDGGALFSVRTFIDKNDGLTLAFVNRAGPIRINGKIEVIHFHVAVRAAVDVPGPAAFAFS